MNSNQTSKKSWVSDINKSEADIKQKEKVSKIFKYSTFIVGCTMLIFVVFLLGKSKLKVINPKLAYVESGSINRNHIEPQTKIKQKITPIPKSDKKRIKEKVTTIQVINSSDNHLDKHRPNHSLNKDENQLISETENSKNGNYITYYDNGNKWVELYFVNGLREGTQYSWHKNGQLKSELNYVNGKKHGSQKWWQKNGKILNHKNYQNGEWINN